MLFDVTVVEIGESLAVAYAGRMLADAGTTVTVAELVELVEPSRPRAFEPDFAEFLRAGKQAIGLPSGASDISADLVVGVDVVLCDDRRTFDRLATLRSANPDLIIVCVTNYGLTGPDADTPASELTLQTEAGIAVMHVTDTSAPLICAIPVAELAGGVNAAIGAVNALLARDAGGRQIDVDVSRLESLTALLTFPWDWERVDGHAPYASPVDGDAPFIPPMNTIPEICEAKDGWVCIAAHTPPQWKALKEMMGVPGLDDPRFDQGPTRPLYRAEVVPLLRSFTSQHTVAELIALAGSYHLPVSPVADPASAYTLPPYADRDATTTPAHGRYRQPLAVCRFTDTRADGEQAGADGRVARAPECGALSIGAPVSERSTPAQPLAGLRVVAFETFHAGPLATSYLARLGADVIKVEAVNRPDLIRFAGLPFTADRSWERGATFIALNVGKRGITADLSDPVGVDIARRLTATADVVLDSFVPRALDDRGLDYAGVRSLRPDVIMTRMPGWGLTGGWAARPAYTQLAESASGTAVLSGRDGDSPRLTGTIFDPMSGLFAVFGTLTAIRHRQVTGRGCQVEVALCDTALQMTAREMIRLTGGGAARARSGNRSSTLAPQGIYRCGDGRWIGLSVVDDDAWSALATVPRAPGWVQDAGLAVAAERIARQDELDELVGSWCASEDADSLVASLRAAGIPAAPLGIGGELIDHPQIRARERVFHAPHEIVGTLPFLGPAWRLSSSPAVPDATSAPFLGQDNAAVLTELGFSRAEIDDLALSGAIGSVPYAKPAAAARADSQ